MASVFHRLIKKEFGSEKYKEYFSTVTENIVARGSQNNEVFNDIYAALQQKDEETIVDMRNRLNDAMLRALRINKTFIGVVLAYIASVCILLALQLGTLITLGAIFIMTICFTIKSYEFYENRNCYVDAQIILMYKAAIDKILCTIVQTK